MRTSQRELRGLATAAALGMGYPHGLAEELARAVVWLTVRNVDGLGALMEVGPAAPEDLDDPAGTVRVGLEGPGMLDLLVAEPDAGLQLLGLDASWLFIGLCGVTAARHGVTIEVRSGDSALAVRADSADLGGSQAADQVLALAEHTAGPLHITCHPNPSAAPGAAPTVAGPQVARLSVADERWRAAEQLAAKTYVPTSEHSRHHGAGAGVTDND